MLEYAAFSSDGNHIVTASRDEKATVWDAKTGEAVADLVGHKSPVMRAAFSADGKRVITASADKTGAHLGRRTDGKSDRHAVGSHRHGARRRLQPGRQAGRDGGERQERAPLERRDRRADHAARRPYARR